MSQQAINKPPRPLLRYHGGKWKLASWIISYFPNHTRYVEPYCGAANILLKKQPAYSEVINDINDEVINLFEVISTPTDRTWLQNDINYTPYSRVVFENAKTQQTPCNMTRAKNFLIRSHMGFNAAAPNTGFRSNSNRTSSTPAHNWRDMPFIIGVTAKRIRGVIIENQCALKTMRQHDCKDTLHFVDPPYLPSTRTATSKYVYDLSELDHIELLECIHSLKGMVVLCGYNSNLYQNYLVDTWGWVKVEKQTRTAQNQKRTECIWLNPLCQQRLRLEA